MLFETIKGSDEINRDASISDCMRYRYMLKRWWANEGPWATWIMLNPSTADAAVDDPTIRKCIHYSKAIGMAGMTVVNLFAWRTAYPELLRLCFYPDAVGPNNDWYINTIVGLNKGPIIAAWGTKGGRRARAVIEMLSGREIHCLKITKDGHPQHPLYLPNSASLIFFHGVNARK